MRLVAALLLVASTARAEPPTGQAAAADTDGNFSFAWAAPAGCPNRAEVLGRAEKLVGHTLSRTSGAQPTELEATVQSLPNAIWQLSVRSGSHNDGPRSVSASSCEELADAMALLIALSLDPVYAARRAATPLPVGQASFAETAPLPESAPAPAPLPVVQPAPRTPPLATTVMRRPNEAQPPRVAPRVQLALGALAAVWVGRLPGAAPGGVLHAAVARQKLVLSADLGLFPVQRVTVPGGGADLSLATLGGSFGYALFDGLLTPYAGLELDRLHGVGTAVKTSSSGNIWLLGVDAGARLAYPHRAAFRLLVDAHASALAQHARFHIDPNVELFAPPRLGAQFGLGAELRLR